MEEFKKSLDLMGAELMRVVSEQELLLGLFEEVKRMKAAVSDRDKKITELEQKVAELEQYTRREDLLFTGLDIKHWTCAQVAANVNTTEDSAQEELLTLEQQVVTFL